MTIESEVKKSTAILSILYDFETIKSNFYTNRHSNLKKNYRIILYKRRRQQIVNLIQPTHLLSEFSSAQFNLVVMSNSGEFQIDEVELKKIMGKPLVTVNYCKFIIICSDE